MFGLVNAFINYSIEALFLTNVWVFLYVHFLSFLNTKFPPVVREQFVRIDVITPQPFQIPLYLFLSLLFILVIWVFHTVSKEKVSAFSVSLSRSRFLFVLRSLVLITLLFIFIRNLGLYPMSNDTYPYIPRLDRTVYNFITFLYLITLAVVIIESTIIYPLIKKSKKYVFIFFGMIALLIGFFTFEPKFPFSPHDYAFFFGPILDIAQGKTIYTDIPSQHGFLSILFFALLYKLNFLQLAYLPVYVWFLYIIEYFFIFYLILRLSQSVILSLIGMFSVLTVNYFSVYHFPAAFPQIGPLRWLPLFISLVLFYRLKKIDSRLLVFFIALLSFWFIDAGMALLASYGLTIFIFFLTKRLHFKEAVIACIWLFISLFFIIAAINMASLALGYKYINPINIFNTVRKYAAEGVAQLPMENREYFWAVMFIYFSSIIFFLKEQTKTFNKSVVLFSANLMLFASIYFVGRPHPHNFFHIAPFAIVNFFLLVGIILKNISEDKIKLFVIPLFFVLFILYPSLMRQTTMAEMILAKYERLKTGHIFQPEMEEVVNSEYKNERDLINRYLPEKQIVILSADDTYLLYLTGKDDLLLANPQNEILTQNDLRGAVKEAVRLCPRKIAADCSVVSKCPPYQPLGRPSLIIADILHAMENQCQIKYEPVNCTDKLCILEAG